MNSMIFSLTLNFHASEIRCTMSRTHTLRYNLNLKLTLFPSYHIGFKGKVKLKWSGEYGSRIINENANIHLYTLFKNISNCIIESYVRDTFVNRNCLIYHYNIQLSYICFH